MDLGVLYRYGSRHADERAGRIRRTAHCRGTLSYLDAPVAGLLAAGGSPCRHAAVHSARHPLVCGHVLRPWRCLCRRREDPYDRPIPQSDGRTPGYDLFLSPGLVFRIFPLERASSCPTLSHTQRMVSHTSCAHSAGPHWNIRTRPLCGAMGGGRLCLLHGLCNPPPPLYRSIVSRRCPSRPWRRCAGRLPRPARQRA